MSLRIHVAVLGPLLVERNGRPVAVSGRRQRAVLAALAAYRGGCTARLLLDLAWADEQPASELAALRVEVSALRKRLADSRETWPIVTTHDGYRLDHTRVTVDADEFRMLFARAQQAMTDGDPRRAARDCNAALSLWRGTPFPELDTASAIHGHRYELDVQRRSTERLRLFARAMTDDKPGELLADLRLVVQREPYDEGLHVLLMKQLRRQGLRADALAVFDQLRESLVSGFGVEPGDQAQTELSELLRLTSSSSRAAAPEVRANDLSEEHVALVCALIEANGGSIERSLLTSLSEDRLDEAIDDLARIGAVSVSGTNVSLTTNAPRTLPSLLAAAHGTIAAHLITSFESSAPDVVFRVADHMAAAASSVERGSAREAFVRAAELAMSLGRGDIAALNRRRERLVLGGLELQLESALHEAEALRLAGREQHALLLLDRILEEAEAIRAHDLTAQAVLAACMMSERSAETEAKYGPLRDRLIDASQADSRQLATDLRVRLRSEAAASALILQKQSAAEELARKALMESSGASRSAMIEALTGAHQAIWRANNLDERLEWAEQATDAARSAGTPVQLAHGQLLLTSDLLEAGAVDSFHNSAVQAVIEADRCGLVRFRWAARTWLALSRELSGNRVGATHAAEEALSVWPGKLHPEASSASLARRMSQRLRASPRGVVDELRFAMAQYPDEPTVRLALAVALSASGHESDARATALSEPVSLGSGPTELATIALYGELAIHLKDNVLANEVLAATSELTQRHLVGNAFGAVGFYWGSVHDLRQRLSHI